MSGILICDSLDNGSCVNPQLIEVSQESLDYISQYQAFNQDYYEQGFMSVMVLFVAGLAVGIIIKQIRNLR